MCRLKNYLPVHILRLLYNSLVLPYLQYGILTWGFKIGRIEKLQKRAVRIITCSKYNAHTEPLFKTLNLLKVSDMFTLNLLKMYYKYKNQSLPFYVMNMFTDAIEPHDYNLRNKYVLQSSVARTQSGDKCVRCYLPHLINNTDENILTKISTHSYQGFVFYVKTSILNSYSTLCTTNNCYVCNHIHCHVTMISTLNHCKLANETCTTKYYTVVPLRLSFMPVLDLYVILISV